MTAANDTPKRMTLSYAEIDAIAAEAKIQGASVDQVMDLIDQAREANALRDELAELKTLLEDIQTLVPDLQIFKCRNAGGPE